jgi:hypothetical protein
VLVMGVGVGVELRFGMGRARQPATGGWCVNCWPCHVMIFPTVCFVFTAALRYDTPQSILAAGIVS